MDYQLPLDQTPATPVREPVGPWSPGGAEYLSMMVIVGDYSRFARLYFLKKMSDGRAVFASFLLTPVREVPRVP